MVVHRILSFPDHPARMIGKGYTSYPTFDATDRTLAAEIDDPNYSSPLRPSISNRSIIYHIDSRVDIPDLVPIYDGRSKFNDFCSDYSPPVYSIFIR